MVGSDRDPYLCTVVMILLAGSAAACSATIPPRPLDRELKGALTCVRSAARNDAGRLYADRFYTGPGDTDSRKFSDPSKLTAPEVRLIEQYRGAVRPCKDMIVRASTDYAPSDVPAWTAFFARSDEVWLQVSTGRLTVGEANIYSLSSLATLQQELANALPATTSENRELALERQRQAQKTLRYSVHILQSEREAGRAVRCHWAGNVLQCSAG
jgi:hypothetical protein